MPEWHDVPEEPLTPSALVAESQHIMARNARKANMRANLRNYETLEMKAWELAKAKDQRIAELKVMLTQAEKEYAEALQKAKDIHNEGESARSIPIDEDESTAEVERKLAELEEINSKVRANADKQKAIDDAENARQKYIVLTATVEEVRAKRRKLLESIKLPLPGLGVENGELVYNGQKWDCMSGMEQIKVAVAIIRQRKPECGFILLDKIEAFDLEQLAALSEWLKSENLQAIATRVSTGEECSIIIEDGLVVAAQNDDQELDW
jgi:acyl transferase domain-containing protein